MHTPFDMFFLCRRGPKSKKKSKKTKFKSVKNDQELDLPHPVNSKKRKESSTMPEDPSKDNKKPRKDSEFDLDSQSPETLETEDLRDPVRTKTGGKISIMVMPVKRIMVVKPEKLRKKGNIWSKDFFPSPDTWSNQEDAILCAVVNEYSTNWFLVSDALYSVSTGGFYRGIFRHPAHCSQRFRELFFKYFSCGVDGANSEKVQSSGLGKALLKVTEVASLSK